MPSSAFVPGQRRENLAFRGRDNRRPVGDYWRRAVGSRNDLHNLTVIEIGIFRISHTLAPVSSGILTARNPCLPRNRIVPECSSSLCPTFALQHLPILLRRLWRILEALSMPVGLAGRHCCAICNTVVNGFHCGSVGEKNNERDSLHSKSGPGLSHS